jgi:glucose-1-phosphate adenylyltransferase
MYDEHWPIRTFHPNFPPPKFVFAEDGPMGRRGQALDSIVCPGCIISGGSVQRSILGHGVRINSFARVEDSILFHGVNIGRRAQVRRAIIDKGVDVPPGTEVGFNPEQDRKRGFVVTEGGVTVIAKTDGVNPFPESEEGQGDQ